MSCMRHRPQYQNCKPQSGEGCYREGRGWPGSIQLGQ